MVQAIIKISDRTNRILNIVKAKYGLKDKSAAIELMASQYEEEILEPELRPEFIEHITKTETGKHIFVGGVENFDKVVDNFAAEDD